MSIRLPNIRWTRVETWEGWDDVSERGTSVRAAAGIGADHHSYFEPAAVPGDRMAADEVSEVDAEAESQARADRADDSAGDADAGGDFVDSCGGAADFVGGRAGAVSAGQGADEPGDRDR